MSPGCKEYRKIEKDPYEKHRNQKYDHSRKNGACYI